MLESDRVTNAQALGGPPRGFAGYPGLAWPLCQGVMTMKVRDGMTGLVLTIGPAHTLREAARLMSGRRVGAAVVVDADHSGIGILTERDILDSVGAGQNPDTEQAAAHRTQDVVFASPEWTLDQAASTMVRSGFRHLIVLEDGEVAGLLSMRDIVRVWAGLKTSQPTAAHV